MAENNTGPCSRSIYLITYSQANIDIVPTSVSFKDVILEAFEKNGKARIVRWMCSKEEHKDGGFHYHMVVKLDRQKRWMTVRNFLDNTHSIKVNFSNTHANYYDAWQYATKADQTTSKAKTILILKMQQFLAQPLPLMQNVKKLKKKDNMQNAREVSMRLIYLR